MSSPRMTPSRTNSTPRMTPPRTHSPPRPLPPPVAPARPRPAPPPPVRPSSAPAAPTLPHALTAGVDRGPHEPQILVCLRLPSRLLMVLAAVLVLDALARHVLPDAPPGTPLLREAVGREAPVPLPAAPPGLAAPPRTASACPAPSTGIDADRKSP